MKSISSEDNRYFSFTHDETGIEVVWEFNEQEMNWTVLVYKDAEKEIVQLPASAAPTTENVNDYDLNRLSAITIKMTNFLSEKAKARKQTSDK